MKNVMLDLETMGTGNNAAIVAIGAVEFSLEDGVSTTDTFYNTIDLDSAVKHGGVIDPKTVIWWLQQSDEARKEIYAREGKDMEAALWAFRNYLFDLDSERNVRIWGNGATFDNVVLRNAYLRSTTGLAVPWYFRNDMCYRTIKNLYPGEQLDLFEGVAHNALDDARYQADHLVKIARNYNINL